MGGGTNLFDRFPIRRSWERGEGNHFPFYEIRHPIHQLLLIRLDLFRRPLPDGAGGTANLDE